MVINQNGRAESIFSRNEIILSKERQEVFFMGFRLHHSLLQEFDDEFGPVGCFVIHRDSAKLVSVPFGEYNVVLVMKNDIDHDFLVNKMKKIEESYDLDTSEPRLVYVEATANG